MSLKLKIGIAIIIIILLVIAMDRYDVKPMALLDGKSPFTSETKKMKMQMEELISSIHAAQGIQI